MLCHTNTHTNPCVNTHIPTYTQTSLFTPFLSPPRDGPTADPDAVATREQKIELIVCSSLDADAIGRVSSAARLIASTGVLLLQNTPCGGERERETDGDVCQSTRPLSPKSQLLCEGRNRAQVHGLYCTPPACTCLRRAGHAPLVNARAGKWRTVLRAPASRHFGLLRPPHPARVPLRVCRGQQRGPVRAHVHTYTHTHTHARCPVTLKAPRLDPRAGVACARACVCVCARLRVHGEITASLSATRGPADCIWRPDNSRVLSAECKQWLNDGLCVAGEGCEVGFVAQGLVCKCICWRRG